MIPPETSKRKRSSSQKLVQNPSIDPEKLSKILTAAARILRGDQSVKVVVVKKRGGATP